MDRILTSGELACHKGSVDPTHRQITAPVMQLTGDHSRPLGLGECARTQARVDTPTCTIDNTKRASCSTELENCMAEVSKLVEKRSNHPSSPPTCRQVCILDVSGTEKRWFPHTDNRSPGAEQVQTMGTFLDVGNVSTERHAAERQLDGETGSKECILGSPDPSELP